MEELSENSQLLHQIITAVLLFGGTAVAMLCFQFHRRNPPDCAELTKTIARRSWTTRQVGIVISSIFLLYLLASFSGLLLYEEQIPLARLLITIGIYFILVLLITYINRKRGESWALSLGMGASNLKKLVLAPVFYLAFIPFLMLASKGYHQLLELIFKSQVELQDIAQLVSGEFSWLEMAYMLMAILAAPVYEELIFRGILFPYLVHRAGLKVSIALVSVLFALMHFHLPSFIPLALLSAALCLAYWRTGSLWVSIGFHMIFNAVSILALNLAG